MINIFTETTPLFFSSEITHFLLNSLLANLFSLCRDIFGFLFYEYISYLSLHLMWLYLTYFVIVFLDKEYSIICSKCRSFCFVIVVYLSLVQCDFFIT